VTPDFVVGELASASSYLLAEFANKFQKVVGVVLTVFWEGAKLNRRFPGRGKLVGFQWLGVVPGEFLNV
jgi:hypothetical protein